MTEVIKGYLYVPLSVSLGLLKMSEPQTVIGSREVYGRACVEVALIM